MLKTLIFVILAGALQSPIDAFKKEMTPLQNESDNLVRETGSSLMSGSRAMLIEGYGVIVSVEVAFEPPSNPLFPSATSKELVLAHVRDRQKEIKSRITALIKQRITSMESIGEDESLTIVVHLDNYNPLFVPNLPKQLVFSAKKSAPQLVTYKEI